MPVAFEAVCLGLVYSLQSQSPSMLSGFTHLPASHIFN